MRKRLIELENENKYLVERILTFEGQIVSSTSLNQIPGGTGVQITKTD